MISTLAKLKRSVIGAMLGRIAAGYQGGASASRNAKFTLSCAKMRTIKSGYKQVEFVTFTRRTKTLSVVASEVRALAQRSATAAKEIKTLIGASDRNVLHGVQLVGQTGEALSKIAQQVADINGVVADIAASASEQAAGLAEVNTAVNQMDQMTQQNAAMVEEATAAAKSLAGDAHELGRLVGQFHLETTGEGPARRMMRNLQSRVGDGSFGRGALLAG